MPGIWTLGLWTSGLGKIGRLHRSLGPKNLKLHFTVKGEVADYDIFNTGFSCSKNKSFLLESCRQGVTMFLERRASVKWNLSVFNVRFKAKVTGFPLSNWSMV